MRSSHSRPSEALFSVGGGHLAASSPNDDCQGQPRSHHDLRPQHRFGSERGTRYRGRLIRQRADLALTSSEPALPACRCHTTWLDATTMPPTPIRRNKFVPIIPSVPDGSSVVPTRLSRAIASSAGTHGTPHTLHLLTRVMSEMVSRPSWTTSDEVVMISPTQTTPVTRA
jgi:hypothetical protein